MNRFFIAVVVASMMAALAFASAGRQGNQGDRFLSLWEGVDSIDGSSQQILISGGEDGGFNLLWRESFWTVCDGRRAILMGVGEIASDDKNTLVCPIVITCFGPDELVVEDTLTFELVGKEMLLATSANGVFENLPLYRLSNRLRGGSDDD